MPVSVAIPVGQYTLSSTSLLDVRITDLGAVISVCDRKTNTRYTALITPEGEALVAEKDVLVRPEVARHAGSMSSSSTSVEGEEAEHCDTGDGPEFDEACDPGCNGNGCEGCDSRNAAEFEEPKE